ncbi:MAG: hypothetical protein JWM35_985 [Verrucomicrobia bacterium]|nr:hypothetical protein [Verrucomicrobiota bacterium]
MKNFLLFRFVPERLLRTRFFARAAVPLATPLPPEPKPERGRIRYVPIQIGAQIMPYIVDTGEPTNRK